MITEDQFKDLTDSLEVIGHYDPSVKDMLTCIRDSSHKWVNFSIFHNSGIYENIPKWEVKVKVSNMPEERRFGKVIYEFAMNLEKFYSLVEEMGMTTEIYHTGNSHEITLRKVPK